MQANNSRLLSFLLLGKQSLQSEKLRTVNKKKKKKKILLMRTLREDGSSCLTGQDANRSSFHGSGIIAAEISHFEFEIIPLKSFGYKSST